MTYTQGWEGRAGRGRKRWANAWVGRWEGGPIKKRSTTTNKAKSKKRTKIAGRDQGDHIKGAGPSVSTTGTAIDERGRAYA
mmetsp:Transcript_7672/g.18807  ORF Transcript_7672/g.18807 Transcript_7672/m.18807 type:complete len:81 (-) Transcript_7672:193-435(-)